MKFVDSFGMDFIQEKNLQINSTPWLGLFYIELQSEQVFLLYKDPQQNKYVVIKDLHEMFKKFKQEQHYKKFIKRYMNDWKQLINADNESINKLFLNKHQHVYLYSNVWKQLKKFHNKTKKDLSNQLDEDNDSVMNNNQNIPHQQSDRDTSLQQSRLPL